MTTYSEFRPTGFDPAGAFLPDRQDWLVAPVSRTRDSQVLAESNFATALKLLGGESETVEVHRFGHWGPGWFEIILVHPSLARSVEDIEASLENYPVLDDEDLSRRESEAETEAWDQWGRRAYWRGVCRAMDDCPDICDDATDEEIDAFAEKARSKCNWVCQHTDEGPTFNIGGMVDATDLDAVLEWAEQAEFEKRRTRDIRRYFEAFGVSPDVISLALQNGIDRFTQLPKQS